MNWKIKSESICWIYRYIKMQEKYQGKDVDEIYYKQNKERFKSTDQQQKKKITQT